MHLVLNRNNTFFDNRRCERGIESFSGAVANLHQNFHIIHFFVRYSSLWKREIWCLSDDVTCLRGLRHGRWDLLKNKANELGATSHSIVIQLVSIVSTHYYTIRWSWLNDCILYFRNWIGSSVRWQFNYMYNSTECSESSCVVHCSIYSDDQPSIS